MNTFSIREALRFGWRTFWKRPWFLLGAVVLMAVFSFSLSFKTSSWEEGMRVLPYAIIFGILYGVVATAVEILFLRFWLKAHDAVETMHYRDAWPPRPFWKYVGTKILASLAIILGFILLIVPGIIIALGLMFATYLVVDKSLWPIEALKESWRITKGHKWQLLLFGLTIAGINILGALALIVGLLISMPVSMLATVYVYRILARTSSPAPIVN